MESIKGYDQWKLQSDEEARHEPRPVSSKGSTQPDFIKRGYLTPEEKEQRRLSREAQERGACYD